MNPPQQLAPARSAKKVVSLDAITILLFEGLVLTMYGLFVSYLFPSSFHYDIYASLLVFGVVAMLLLGTVSIHIGFGMLLAYNPDQPAAGLLNNILILSIVVQLYFLFNVFFTRLRIQQSSDDIFHAYQMASWIGELSNISRYGMSFINAIGCSLTVLISYFNLHGKISSKLLVGHTVLGVIAYEINRQVFLRLKIHDNGGSMGVFLLGAVAGLIAGKLVGSRQRKTTTSAINYIFAFIGVGFIWCFLPVFSSLNQALSLQSTAVDPFVGFSPINTWIALSFGTIWSYVISKMKNGEVSPHDLICGSICGGIAYGSSASFIQKPLGAVVVGVTAAVCDILVAPYVFKLLKIPFTSRPNRMTASFLLAGYIGGLFSILFALFVLMQGYDNYSFPLYWDQYLQAAMQAAGIGIAIGIGLVYALISSLVFFIMNKRCSYELVDQ